MEQYSDLILEVASLDSIAPKLNQRQWNSGNVSCRYYNISSSELSTISGRAIGEYYSFEGKLDDKSLAQAISRTLDDYTRGKKRIMLIGIGNPCYLADRLGELTLDSVKLNDRIMKLYPLCHELTNITSFEMMSGMVKSKNVDLVIAIDTLATTNIERLGVSIQLTTAGISPGSGVANTQTRLSRESLGVDIIAIGLPLVLSMAVKDGAERVSLTLAKIDIIAKRAASIIAKGINLAIK